MRFRNGVIILVIVLVVLVQLREFLKFVCLEILQELGNTVHLCSTIMSKARDSNPAVHIQVSLSKGKTVQ
jgi:hypothetical protein